MKKFSMQRVIQVQFAANFAAELVAIAGRAANYFSDSCSYCPNRSYPCHMLVLCVNHALKKKSKKCEQNQI